MVMVSYLFVLTLSQSRSVHQTSIKSKTINNEQKLIQNEMNKRNQNLLKLPEGNQMFKFLREKNMNLIILFFIWKTIDGNNQISYQTNLLEEIDRKNKDFFLQMFNVLNKNCYTFQKSRFIVSLQITIFLDKNV